MKLNFFSVLNGKSSPKEVAEEIVKLEKAIPELRQELKNREDQCIRMRQEKLGGGEYSQKDYNKLESGFHQAKLDLKAAEKSLGDLKSKLTTLVQALLTEDKEKLESEKRSHKLNRNKYLEDYLKVMALYHVKQVAIFGPTKSPIAGVDMWRPEHIATFNDEVKSLQAQKKEMTYHEQDKELTRQQHVINSQTVEGNVLKLITLAKEHLED